ncbi:oligosaccharide flippase family protein [Arthrobacter sp. A5]|uniref:oligosaccharide flippase family protein n=1 Tax=Arthrobacter sp. A5 TaxID=576926 RepID=UPI003DAA407C
MSISGMSLRKNVPALLAGQFSRLVLQTAYFIVLARMLGAGGYGTFAAALALAALIAPFSSIGTNTLMVKMVSREPSTARSAWKRAVFYTIIGGIVLSILLALFGGFVTPPGVSRIALFEICIADLVGLKLIEVNGSLWQALGRSKALVVLPSMTNLFRLLAAMILWLVLGSTSLDVWSCLFLLATAPLAIVVTVRTTVKLGSSKRGLSLSRKDAKEGLLYSIALASQNMYNDIDKIMLAKIGSVASAGYYSAAYRIIDVAYVPIRSFAAAAYPHYFREGEKGLRSAIGVTYKILPFVLTYGAVASLGAFFAAPLAPIILGEDYVHAVEIVRALAPLLLLRGISFLAADALTGSGHQAYRTSMQGVIAVINTTLNFLLIPIIGIWGAVFSTLLCEVLLALLLWIYVLLYVRRKRNSEPILISSVP